MQQIFFSYYMLILVGCKNYFSEMIDYNKYKSNIANNKKLN